MVNYCKVSDKRRSILRLSGKQMAEASDGLVKTPVSDECASKKMMVTKIGPEILQELSFGRKWWCSTCERNRMVAECTLPDSSKSKEHNKYFASVNMHSRPAEPWNRSRKRAVGGVHLLQRYMHKRSSREHRLALMPSLLNPPGQNAPRVPKPVYSKGRRPEVTGKSARIVWYPRIDAREALRRFWSRSRREREAADGLER